MIARQPLAPALLVTEIEGAIRTTSPAILTSYLTAGGQSNSQWLVIKYIPAKYCRIFRPDLAKAAARHGNGPRLRISDSPAFTWGTGNYVTPLAYPVSTAIYGRAGIVAALDQTTTGAWRIFDGRLSSNQDLYVQWAICQPAFKWLTLTCHANLANRFIRNAFREAFLIDCVVFYPDQRNAYYTQRQDLWMCVSDWTPRKRLMRGEGSVLRDPRLAILVSEEFAPIGEDVRRRSIIGPRGQLPPNARLASDIRLAFQTGEVMELTT